MPETVCKPAQQLKGEAPPGSEASRVATFVIGAGSNLRSPSENLARGLSHLCRVPDVRVTAVSRVYETDPVGPPQPRYLNAAVRVSTELSAHALLDQLHAIEASLGRVRDVRWGPRTLDLDLLWADQQVSTERLRVPHPHLNDRTFALAPLIDVAPELAAEFAPVLERLGGTPAVWGRLSLHADAVTCERDVHAANRV